jgi:Rad3-related DNA helicase
MDVLVCPYELILDRKGRNKLLNYFCNELEPKIPSNKRKTLIIFDEGHNLFEKACEGQSYRINL